MLNQQNKSINKAELKELEFYFKSKIGKIYKTLFRETSYRHPTTTEENDVLFADSCFLVLDVLNYEAFNEYFVLKIVNFKQKSVGWIGPMKKEVFENHFIREPI